MSPGLNNLRAPSLKLELKKKKYRVVKTLYKAFHKFNLVKLSFEGKADFHFCPTCLKNVAHKSKVVKSYLKIIISYLV